MNEYYCPKDQSPLVKKDSSFVCPKCNHVFLINNSGIALLDVIQLPEAHAFDEQHYNYESMSIDEIERSKQVANNFLSILKALPNEKLNVLDVACGKGELTIGLAMNEQLRNSTIFAFDHSLASVEALVRTANVNNVRNKIEVSTQDISSLCFSENFFDLVFGNAVLHHFLDWRSFINTVSGILKPRGSIILAEPFAEGYVIPVMLCRLAAQSLKLSPEQLQKPDMGWYEFIVDNIGKRISHREDPEFLSTLTDKHLFLVEDFLGLGNDLGFKVSFENYVPKEYYANFMKDFLSTYLITNPEFCHIAEELYQNQISYLGNEYSKLFSHFRYIVLEKNT
jgi:2-polyprenyl-3-methyl-5-hydroxy-6-metoxy-1,4-benzoquinol methylase